MVFWSVRDWPLAAIWRDSPAFQAFRGTEWMPEPCRSCDQREIDFGGCRCQALAITGDPTATDPACELAPHHGRMLELAEQASAPTEQRYAYRGRVTRGASQIRDTFMWCSKVVTQSSMAPLIGAADEGSGEQASGM